MWMTMKKVHQNSRENKFFSAVVSFCGGQNNICHQQIPQLKEEKMTNNIKGEFWGKQKSQNFKQKQIKIPDKIKNNTSFGQRSNTCTSLANECEHRMKLQQQKKASKWFYSKGHFFSLKLWNPTVWTVWAVNSNMLFMHIYHFVSKHMRAEWTKSKTCCRMF